MRIPEARERIDRWLRAGNSPDTREAHSRAQKLVWERLSSREYRQKCESFSEGHRGVQVSEETRRRLGLALREFWSSLSTGEIEERLKNSLQSKTARENLAEIVRTPKYREKLSRSLKLFWAGLTPEEKAERIKNSVGSGFPESPNGPESMLQKFLDRFFPDMFIPDWVERVDIGGRHPDFRTRNGYKLVIESNGNHWHYDWGEEEQIVHYRKYGWDCIVVWADSAEDIIYEWPNLAKRIERTVRMQHTTEPGLEEGLP